MGFDAITVARMIEVDRSMVGEYGILLRPMMENAGRGLVEGAPPRTRHGRVALSVAELGGVLEHQRRARGWA